MKSLKKQLKKYTGILNKRVHGDFDIEEYLQFVEEYNDLLEQELKAEREKLQKEKQIHMNTFLNEDYDDDLRKIARQYLFKTLGRIEQINEILGSEE